MDHQAFLQTGIDLRPLGLEQGDVTSPYDCTPLGAQVLYWTGVDGIHYCTIPEYGGMVFAVEPMGLPGEVVQPVAEDFAAFLRLLLDHTEAAIQQMGRWSRKQYENFRQGEWPDVEQQAVRDAITALGLKPLEDAYTYVTALQAGFDRAQVRFSKAYLDASPNRRRRENAGGRSPLTAAFPTRAERRESGWQSAGSFCGRGIPVWCPQSISVKRVWWLTWPWASPRKR